MNIIIVGCGKVGSTVAEQLFNEGHDICVIDCDENAVERITQTLDVRGIAGNGAIYNVQLEAGVENADLFIAVTPNDELNLLCCLIAQKSTHCETVARVRDPEYLSERTFIKERLGLSMIINPEFEAAAEINRLFRIPSAIEVDTFASGKVELLKMKIPSGSPLSGKPIYEAMGKFSGKILICAVERNSEVIIPSGTFVLKDGDEISFVSSHGETAGFFKKAGIDSGKIKNIIIIGGGKIAYYLANMLAEYNFKLTIIEKDKKRCEFLSAALPSSVVVINGDGSDQQLLFEEGFDEADGFVTLTDFDEENIMLSLYAKDETNAKVVTKINKLNFDNVIDKLDIGSTVYPKYITSEMIVSFVRALENSQGSNVQKLYKIVDNKVEALEFYTRTESDVTGIHLSDLELKDNLLVACITRNGKMIIPNGLTTIEVGDTVLVVTTQKGLNDLRDILE